MTLVQFVDILISFFLLGINCLQNEIKWNYFDLSLGLLSAFHYALSDIFWGLGNTLVDLTLELLSIPVIVLQGGLSSAVVVLVQLGEILSLIVCKELVIFQSIAVLLKLGDGAFVLVGV